MKRRGWITFLAAAFAVFFVLSAYADLRNSSEFYKEGEALAKEGRFDEALPYFKDAVAKNPYYSLGHYGLGRVYLQDEDSIELAIKHLERSVELDRSFAKAWFYLGMGYFINRKYPMALNAFSEAFEKDRTMAEALYNISVIYDMMGKTERSNFYHMRYEKLKAVDDDFLFR